MQQLLLRGFLLVTTEQQGHQPGALAFIEQIAFGQQLADHALLLRILQGGNPGLLGINRGSLRRACKNVPYQRFTMLANLTPVGCNILQKTGSSCCQRWRCSLLS